MIHLDKYVIELRYQAVVQAFDRRGKILETVMNDFEKKLKFWNVDNAAITIQETDSSNKRNLHVGHMRSYISYENPDSLTEFSNDAKRFFDLVYKVLPEIKEITRVGCRCISFRGGDEKISVYQSNLGKWLSPALPLSIPIIDSTIINEYEYGRIVIGTAKPSDGFIQREFPNYSNPKIGEIAGNIIDVDSFIKDVRITKGETLSKFITPVRENSLALLREVEASIGLTK